MKPLKHPSAASRSLGRPRRTVADRQLMALMGTRLKWVREALGISQQAIAEAAGVHQTLWSLYERGLRMPDEFAATRLIAKLRISRAYLMDGSLQGVERELAIRLAARRPELAETTSTDRHTGTDQV